MNETKKGGVFCKRRLLILLSRPAYAAVTGDARTSAIGIYEPTSGSPIPKLRIPDRARHGIITPGGSFNHCFSRSLLPRTADPLFQRQERLHFPFLPDPSLGSDCSQSYIPVRRCSKN